MNETLKDHEFVELIEKKLHENEWNEKLWKKLLRMHKVLRIGIKDLDPSNPIDRAGHSRYFFRRRDPMAHGQNFGEFYNMGTLASVKKKMWRK